MAPLDLVKLPELMELTAGRSDVVIGLIDGPVALDQPDLARNNIREAQGGTRGACARPASTACLHGTFVAGILCAKRGSNAPAICPNCTLLIRPVFTDMVQDSVESLGAAVEELADAIVECIEAGARILNLSLALMRSSSQAQLALSQALGRAAQRGVIVVAAAGNQGTVGSTVITAHPWVIPVAACDLQGKPLDQTNLGHSIGRQGFRAPGEQITSLGAQGEPLILRGTSAAAPFVTGAIALVWSQFPSASGAALRLAFMRARARARSGVTPPLLNAWGAYRVMLAAHLTR
ncbi:MAG: S8 family serine peptidase [Deltaproteobacteria bacterium]|nr:S8 family serine peptidase [Deltaproteobacteria bacterium]